MLQQRQLPHSAVLQEAGPDPAYIRIDESVAIVSASFCKLARLLYIVSRFLRCTRAFQV